MKFGGLDEFEEFLNNPNVSDAFKQRVIDEVLLKSNDRFSAYAGFAGFGTTNRGRRGR